jgi:D-alanyl-D-alanine carboxypeptidase/D-alanyl-D-alanine-endopeptidase (penicillin-binding protein 4)
MRTQTITALRIRVLLALCILGCVFLAPRYGTEAQTHAQSAANPVAKPAHAAQRAAPTRADADAFQQRVQKILSAADVDRGYWGLIVEDADSGEILFTQNGDRYFAPASNAKLFATALVLATLGTEYRFHTTLETHASVTPDGVLSGDLILVGRGDPDLSNRQMPYAEKTQRDGPPEKILAELADALVARGVKQITGNIVGDDSYFAGGRYPSGWSIDDMLWSYGAPVSALEINDGTLFVDVGPGAQAGAPIAYTVEPWAGDLMQIHNLAVTSARGSEPQLEFDREPGTDELFISGSVPEDAQMRSSGVAIGHPAEYAAALLKQLLESRGVQIYGKAVAKHAETAAPTNSLSTAPTPAAATVLAEHVSLPLADAIRVVNKVSQNLHAEMLLRDAAREKTGDPSADAALKFAEDFRASLGITKDDAVLTDACGLSRSDLVTPESVAKVLRWVSGLPWAQVYRDSLPVAGEDGTLSDRMKNTPAAGHVFAKTGTLGHVNSLSGYATTKRGENLVFSFFGNNHTMKSKPAEDVLDAIVVAMVEEFGKPRAAARKK